MIARLILFIVLFITGPVWAAGSINSMDSFNRIPILDNGRLKPLDTYARNLLIQFSGKDTYDRKSASQWLARLLFKPESCKDDKIFLINSPDVAIAIDIEPEQHRRYSFGQLQPQYKKFLSLYESAQKISAKERGVVEAEIIRVFDNLITFARLSHEIQFAFPHEDFDIDNPQTASSLGLKPQGPYSFLDIALTADEMRTLTQGIENTAQSQWRTEQVEVMALLNTLFQWSLNYRDLGLAVIPSTKQEDIWISPWDAVATDFQNPSVRRLVSSWQNMATAYNEGKQVEFDLAIKTYLSTLNGMVPVKTQQQIGRFDIELPYHGLRPFFVAKIFYVLAFICLVISFMNGWALWHRLAVILIILGFIPHTLAIIMRCIIMSRPPVTNLFETFVFAGFITVLLGLLIEWVNKRWIGIAVATISGAAMLFIASKYSAEGDTLSVLIAVLNSNFWLGTHVLTITMGYGATCVAGVLGHLWLIQRITKPKDFVTLNSTHKVLLGMLGLALTLTFLGTNLGGIWADQSWGRFWGWDPKENGALMIVLWTAMLFHAKIAGMIKQIGLAIGAVIGMMVVMWAWFGVNLLSIGLHSYGFTSGIATSLIVYAVIEVLFIVITLILVKRT